MLDKLPVELLFKIYSYLGPEHAVRSKINKKINNQITSTNAIANQFWKEKFIKHFPDTYKKVKDSIDINWYQSFKNIYKDEYALHNIKIRKLFSLVKEGDIEGLKSAEIEIEDLDKYDKHDTTLLYWAMRLKDQAILDYFYQLARTQYLLTDITIDARKTDKNRRTLLHWAIMCHQSLETIKLIHSQDTSIDRKTNFNETELHLAVQAGDIRVVRYFISCGADINARTNAGATPLIFAVEENSQAIVDVLLEHNADMTIPLQFCANYHNRFLVYQGDTPIHAAVKLGNINIVKSLLDKGININIGDCYNCSPLIIAAEHGLIEIVELLLQQGANVNARSVSGATALLITVENNHREVLDLLLAFHANTEIPLQTNSEYHDDLNVSAGDTPLHAAVKLGYIDLTKALVAKGAAINARTTDNNTPLMLAAIINDRVEIGEYLIRQGADINARNNKGATALMCAVKENNVPAFDLLLRHNADIELSAFEDDYPLTPGDTPLHVAARYNLPQIVRRLLGKNANVEARNNAHRRPIDVAPIKASYLDDLRILNYLNKANQRPDNYRKYTITLFGHSIGFGCPNKKKKAAANAIRNVRFYGANKSCLNPHKDAFKHGELKGIYRRLR